MAGTAQGRWTLEHDGRLLEADAPPPRLTGGGRELRLYVDGDLVATKATSSKKAKLTHEDLTVRATWDWRGELSNCALVPARTEADIKDAKDLKELIDKSGETWFTPPEGSRAARRERLARRHPRLYASRHVALAAARVLLPLLGIAALIKIPKPHIDLPDIDLPGIPRPRIPWPDIDLPSIPLPDLPDVTLPGWLQAIVQTAKYWGPILAAVGLAVQEHERRKKQRQKAAERAAAKEAEKAEKAVKAGEPETAQQRETGEEPETGTGAERPGKAAGRG
ncbi:hypothetical protein [Actinomadura sp. 9N407]|uniref:hypothetical protein n=1 Tax=Actinomadura sp. 9N407 TaxID=3375154 RepID=UPI00378B23E2